MSKAAPNCPAYCMILVSWQTNNSAVKSVELHIYFWGTGCLFAGFQFLSSANRFTRWAVEPTIDHHVSPQWVLFLASLSEAIQLLVLTKRVPNNFTLIISSHLVRGGMNNSLPPCIASEMHVDKQSSAKTVLSNALNSLSGCW